MPKRLFRVLSSAQRAAPRPVAVSSMDIGYPRPIEVGDRQRLMKLADPQGKVCASGWTSHEETNSRFDSVSSNADLSVQASSSLPQSALDENSLGAVPLELRQLRHHVRQQQRLRRVERQLRSKLDLNSLLETTAVESASLFGARCVSILQYRSQVQTLQQVASSCNSNAVAEAESLSLSQQAFPQFWQTLAEGRLLSILVRQLMSPTASASTDQIHQFDILEAHPNQPLPDGDLEAKSESKRAESEKAESESNQWLSRWPGNWLLVPVKNVSLTDSVLLSQDESQNESSVTESSVTEPSVEKHVSWGVLALSLSEREVWTEGAIAAAQSLAAELALAIAHAQQYQSLLLANQELQKLALSDGLTSLANRRRFDEHLAGEWQRLARDQRPLSLILCDLDHFKLYNDTFGHPAGDRCLIRVARALLNGPQRPADLVARYGGEEFAIILPNTDTHGAWRIAQKIHESVRALQIPHAEDSESEFVTVTMGVSTVIPGHDNTPQMLVQASDLALYHAKQHGRNRTYVNGHYNTVANRTVAESGTAAEAADQPDVMPLEEPTAD